MFSHNEEHATGIYSYVVACYTGIAALDPEPDFRKRMPQWHDLSEQLRIAYGAAIAVYTARNDVKSVDELVERYRQEFFKDVVPPASLSPTENLAVASGFGFMRKEDSNKDSPTFAFSTSDKPQ